ncbi:MAG: 2Fe-2S iron-sulfur cluster-binding protein [Betaproteobacteria bacterium]
MSGTLTVWRAAQLVGVARRALQAQVRAGELALYDGQIAISDLLRLYPQTNIEDSGMLERVLRIKDESFGKRIRERVLPTQEVLAQRLFGQTQELADVRRHLQQYHRLVVDLQARIRALAAASTGNCEGVDARECLRELEQQLSQGLSEVLAMESVDPLTVMDEMLKVVSARVKVRPSGREFLVEGHATLLQAGLLAGINLNYGCGNGGCGLCKARVVAGETIKIRNHDYPLSETEKLQGHILLCSHTAASSEVMIETLEARGPQDMPPQQIVTKVRAVTPLAADTLLLHLQTPRTNRLRFLAGQSITLGFTSGGTDVHATYPVASCPCDDRNLHLYIARNADDACATALFAGAVKAGDAVTVWGPSGDFVLAEGRRPLVFAACDTAFAPAKSLIEHAMAVDAAPTIALYWLATRADGHFLTNQCRAWSSALDQFEYALYTDGNAAEGARRIADAMHIELLDIQCDFYLAGPADFVATLQDELRLGGVPAGQIFTYTADA